MSRSPGASIGKKTFQPSVIEKQPRLAGAQARFEGCNLIGVVSEDAADFIKSL
mgnify:FL=1